MNNKLVEKYYKKLFAWSLNKTNNYLDTQDLVQEINYQILLALSKDIIIEDEERFIWKVAYYTWCKMAKKYIKDKNNMIFSSELERLVIDENIDISKKIEADEIKEQLNGFIDELGEIDKECIKLYYYQDLSIKEIATRLNMKENLVKYYLYQGRKKLRRCFENENN